MSKFFQKVGQGASKFFNKVVQNAPSVFNKVKNTATQIASQVGQGAQTVGNSLEKAKAFVDKNAGDLSQVPLLGKGVNIVSNALGASAGLAKGVGLGSQALGDLAQGDVKGAVSTGKDAYNQLSSSLTDAGNVVSSLYV